MLHCPPALQIACAPPSVLPDLTVATRLDAWQGMVKDLLAQAARNLTAFQETVLQYDLNAPLPEQIASDWSQLFACLAQVKSYVDAGHRFIWNRVEELQSGLVPICTLL